MGGMSNCRHKVAKDLGFLMIFGSRLQVSGDMPDQGNFQPERMK